jgi:hypothetical protein
MGVVTLTDLGSWTLASGVENADESIRLEDQRVLVELFDGALDTSDFGTLTASGGTVTIEDGGKPVAHSVMTKGSGAAIAAIFLKSTFDETNPFRFEICVRSPEFNTAFANFLLSGYSADPTAGDVGTFQIFMNQLTASTAQLVYRDSGGTSQYWNGAAWQAGSTSFTVPDYSWHAIILSTNGTSWQIQWIDEDGDTNFTTTAVTWANTQALGGGESAYLVLGANQATGQGIFNVSSIERWSTQTEINYLTTSPTATMGQISVGEEIDQIPIAEDNESGSSITWDYDIGSGWVTGKTLAQLNTDLVGESPATLNLRANLVSDGVGRPSFNFDGQAIAGENGGQETYMGTMGGM